MKKINYLIPLLIALCMFLLQVVPIFAGASSELPPKPDVITMACYETTGGTYAQYSILGELINKEYGIKLRLIPCPTDIARVLMINTGRADILGFATGTFFAMEGLGPFAEINLGPQDYRIVYIGQCSYGISLAVRANSGIKTIEDLKGKRVAYFVGNPGMNSIVEGNLAFGGLTWDDVEKVEYRSNAAGYDSVIEGTADATAFGGASSSAYKLEASPHGLYWLPKPAEDVGGWERLNKICPFSYPALFTFGAGCSEENPIWLGAYNNYIFTKPDLEENTAYWITKAIWETYDLATQISDSMVEYNLPESGLKTKWPYPWHEGSIKYLKEVGLWGPAQEANQQPLIDRQEALAELWNKTIDEATDAKMATTEFPAFWLEKRNAEFPEYYKPALLD